MTDFLGNMVIALLEIGHHDIDLVNILLLSYDESVEKSLSLVPLAVFSHEFGEVGYSCLDFFDRQRTIGGNYHAVRFSRYVDNIICRSESIVNRIFRKIISALFSLIESVQT